jgi:hypothetical protein
MTRLDNEWFLTLHCPACGLEIQRQADGSIAAEHKFKAREIIFCSADCYRPWHQRDYDQRIAELLNRARWWMAKLQERADPAPQHAVERGKQFSHADAERDRPEGARITVPVAAPSDAECIRAIKILLRLHRWQARAYTRAKRPIDPLLDQWVVELMRYVALQTAPAAVVALLLGTKKLPGKKTSPETEARHRKIIVAVARKRDEGKELVDAAGEVADVYGLSDDWVIKLYKSRQREAQAALHQI